MSEPTQSSPQRTAIVTGAGSGIGRATAELLADRGFAVVLAARTDKPLQELASILRERGHIALPVIADIARPEHLDRLVATTLERFGRIDAVVNNAGKALLLPIDQHSDVVTDQLYAVNALGPSKLISRVWSTMVTQGGGTIVNVSTIGTKDPFPGFFGYAAAKASVNLMAMSVANEGAEHGIKGFAVAPGAVETPMLRSMFDESAIPSERCLDAADVAQVIVDCVTGHRDADNGKTIFIEASRV